jgi:hypothetical protein
MSAANSPQRKGDAISTQAAPTPGRVDPMSEPAPANRIAWLAVASVAGLAVWAIVQWRYPFFVAPAAKTAGGRGPSPPSDEEIALAVQVAYLNATAVIALAGGLFGAALALREGVRRGQAKRALLPIVGGGVLGGAGGWGGQWLSGLPWLHQLGTTRLGDTPRAVVIQAVCWGLTGLGIGLGLAIPLTRRPHALAEVAAGGALGGLLGTLVYPVLAAVVGIILPAGETLGLIPEGGVDRILWLEAAAICIAAGVSGGAIRQSSNSGPGAASMPAKLVLFLLSGLTVAIVAWGWHFRRLEALVLQNAGTLQEDVASAWKVAPIATDEEFSEERIAHLREIGAGRDLKAVGQEFPKLRVSGWLNGRSSEVDRRGKVLLIDVWDRM